ncbi:MAG: glycolate oxidase subunit GlcF [Proteobacteria bacterium]|nr:glycolate oxidase subunit GlcF [Pseudomonadota bacterium]
MQTDFTLAQLADPHVAASNDILRKCVHCGFCTATCPTYVLLGDELDSPRGRIYLMKEMFESGGPATPQVVKHVDRCLSCLSCMTTCPSGVHYMHLVDHGRKHIEETYRRPLGEKLLRGLLIHLLPYPARFRLAMALGSLFRPLAGIMPGRLKGFLRMAQAPARTSPMDRPQVFPAEGQRRMRVALLTGCVQRVIEPGINEATVRLLIRHGCEVVVARGAGCCGSLVHHMGREEDALRAARTNIAAWTAELEGEGLDAVVINASGCGTTVKDYGFMLRTDSAWAEKAARIAGLAKDVTEVMGELGLMPPVRVTGRRVAYHSACSMQHGQGIRALPKELLSAAGFTVSDVPEGHLCCGSAGTYNLMQPDLADRLRDRKLANIAKTAPEIVATGNIGCMVQLAAGAGVPVRHTVELLDWATGGPDPFLPR